MNSYKTCAHLVCTINSGEPLKDVYSCTIATIHQMCMILESNLEM